MNTKSIFEETLRLYEIDNTEAERLFNAGIVIYIQCEDTKLAPESYNTVMLSNNVWDG